MNDIQHAMEETIKVQLDLLAEAQSQRDLLSVDKQNLIETVLTPEVKAKISDIDAEFLDQFIALDKRIAELNSGIKSSVLAHGSSVKGSILHAIWSKARASWDLKKFDEYALTNPEILSLREMGKPSVSIKRI